MLKSKKLVATAVGSLAALLFAIPALASAPADVNNDRIPDRWEKRHELPLNVNQANRDQDGDELRNMREYREGTDPRDPDSDGDGLGDKPECNGHQGEGEDTTPPSGSTGSQGPQGPPPPPATP